MNIKSDKEIIFDKYTSNYDMNDPDINYKYYHSYRVMENSVLLATKLNLSQKEFCRQGMKARAADILRPSTIKEGLRP